MFSIGDLVIYGGEGVCRVEQIGTPDIPGVNKDKVYYTLSPLYREGRTYTPVDTKVFMRPVISFDEAQRLIRRMPKIEPDECEDKNHRLLSEHYDEFIKTHDCDDLVQLIRTVYFKGQNAVQSKKKLGQIDERYMKRAEEMLYGELAVALDIPRDSVKDYIAQHIEGSEHVG